MTSYASRIRTRPNLNEGKRREDHYLLRQSATNSTVADPCGVSRALSSELGRRHGKKGRPLPRKPVLLKNEQGNATAARRAPLGHSDRGIAQKGEALYK